MLKIAATLFCMFVRLSKSFTKYESMHTTTFHYKRGRESKIEIRRKIEKEREKENEREREVGERKNKC